MQSLPSHQTNEHYFLYNDVDHRKLLNQHLEYDGFLLDRNESITAIGTVILDCLLDQATQLVPIIFSIR